MLQVKAFEKHLDITHDETVHFIHYKRKGMCRLFFISKKKNIFDYLIKFSQKKDPFEKLNSCFKVNEDVKININFDRSLLISLAIVIFQIIEFTLSSIDDEEIRSLNESA